MSLAALVLLGAALGGAGLAPQRERIAALEKKLLAPCCWSETVAVHRSPAALEMKKEIAAFVGQGKTDREILDYYKGKYGARILVEPEGAARVVVNAIPWVAAALGTVAVGLAIRRMTGRTGEPKTQASGALPDVPDDW